jgi:hypothetical protein
MNLKILIIHCLFYKINNKFDIEYNNLIIDNNNIKICYIINYFGYVDKNINKIQKILYKITKYL